VRIFMASGRARFSVDVSVRATFCGVQPIC
jgi:hypothetical protein